MTSTMNMTTKKIDFKITKNTASDVTFEADLPEIIEKNIAVRRSSQRTNKLIIYNKDNMAAAPTIYFLHTDGTHSTTDTDRVVPVRWDYSYIGENDSAADEAAKVFAEEKYDNLITLSMVDAPKLKVGQHVNVIADGVVYPTILTGREDDQVTKLIFGNIRMSLIKQLKGRG